MATANGNVEGLTWSCVKTLLTSSYPSFNKNEIIIDLTTLIIERETSILIHHDDHEAFYSLFVALATNALCSVSGSLSSSTLPQVSRACQVLLRFLLNRLETPNRACAVTPKYMMILINSLCQGGQCLGKSDVVTFTCLFKPTELPPDPEIKEQDSAKKDKLKSSRLSRLDTQKDLFDQMTSVFAQTPSLDVKTLPRTDIGNDDSFDVQPKTPLSTTGGSQDAGEESGALFTKKNAEMLLSMNGAEILLQACSQLTFLSKYMERYRDAISGSVFLLPATLSQALTLRNGYQFLLTEVSDVWQAFSLPIIEPLTPARLRTIVEVAMGCLFAAVSVATADTVVNVVKPSGPTQATGAKDEELDNQGHRIVQKSLEIFSWVSSAVKVSTRAGGNVAQNFNLFAVWVILNGLQGILSLTPAVILERKDTSKTRTSEVVTKREGQAPTARPLSAKGNQPFLSVTAVALANNALQLMTPLLEDLSVETSTCDITSLHQGKTSEGLKLDMLDSLTAWSRVQALLKSLSLHDLLFNLMSVAFRKAVYLTRLKQGSDSQETTSSSSTSDSNTYFEDDFSTSEDNSEADDDYEPILGHWLEEAMSPSDPSSSPPSVSLQVRTDRGRSEHKRQRETSPAENNPPFVPDKWEPEGFSLLVKAVLNFFNTHMLNSSNESIKQISRSGISKEHVSAVAQLTKDLDKECARSDSVDRGYSSLSQELARFNHTLVASGCLTEQLENFFLASLNVSPTEPEPWPLTCHSRTLAVLVSILLRRQQLERCNESSTADTVNNSLRAVWTKFLDRLHGAITWFENKTETVDDVNVEHMQVLLLLFHSLRLAQKKEILVSLCNIIIQVSQMEPSRMQKTVPLPLSRLVLLTEYMLHYFYDPPSQLTEQVQHNLFASQMAAVDKESHNKAMKFFVCREAEDNFRKGHQDAPTSEVASMKPRFYNLCPAEPSAMDVSKVDGLAVSCILSPESKLNYGQFYSACINLLMAGSLCDKTKEKFSHLDACSMHYHFLLLWRLLSCLPPSSEYLNMLKEMSNMGKAHILHTLRWAPRLGHKPYIDWIADCLVKQGVTITKALELVETAAGLSNTCRHDVILAMSFIRHQISKLPVTYTNQLSPKELPGMSDILVLDAVIAKCQVSLDELYTRSMSDPDPTKAMKFSGELIPAVFTLMEAYSAFARSCILNKVCSPEDKSLTSHRLRAFGQVLSVGSNHPSAVRGLGSGVVALLPSSVRSAIDKWNGSGGNEFPSMGAWRNAFASDPIPSESYMDAIHSAHMVTLSGQPSFCINASLRHVLQSLVRFGSDLVVWCPNVASNTVLTQVMFPLIYDVTTEYLGEMVYFLKSKFLGPSEEARFEEKAYKHGIQACDQIIVEFSDAESGLDEKILYECIKFMETCLEKPVARKAFKAVYTENADMTSLLLTVARSNLSDTYTSHILRLFNKLFQQVEREPVDENLSALCQGLTELASVEKGEVQKLLIKIIRGSENVCDDTVVRTNNSLLQSLVKHIVKEKSPIGEQGVCLILQALIPLGAVLLTSSTPSDLRSFPDLMAVLPMLAGMGSGYGHVYLFEAAVQWLQMCMSNMSSKEDLDESKSQRKPSLEILTCLLSYIGEILGALKKGMDGFRPFSPLLEMEPISAHDGDGEWYEELGQEEEDSGGEDSDEEALNNKLCTFTITQKEFMNQHWYHCHTCKMVDGVGVCSICAKVCHKDHDLTYAKFGSFFCDCGAKQDSSCKALVKRTAQAGSDMAASSQSQSPFASDNIHHPHSSLRRRLSSTPESDNTKAITEGTASLEHISKARETLAKQLESFRDKILSHIGSAETVTSILTILDSLMPTLRESYQEASPKGSSFRAQQALRDLHTKPKEVETTTDQLMTVTLGSQEGAFENVRMNYSGDQGQTIRQLLTAHMLRRVAMCVLSSPHGKRQHLAVSHEKGKMTLLQLSALLKQADSSKKKLTLTRLSSAPVPFTVLSISGNPCNEDYLAVCGLKDCHVMTFTSSGTVADHLVLHPSLTTGNFIIKAVWLPGSQTELAIITADFVKIYDLGIDAISPQYYFLLPTGKIRDVTFVCNEDSQAMVLMASSGYIYTQTLEDSSSARHGPFYITNVLEIKHTDLKDINGQVAGGGVSVYYSHALQLLFFSYSQGKSFTAPVAKDLSTVTNLFPISFKSSNGGSSATNANSGNSTITTTTTTTSNSTTGGNQSGGGGVGGAGSGGGKSSGAQPLVSWSEVPGHTGLMYCMAQATNNPIVLMIKPDKITLQEIKVLPSKAKIQDVVAIRHQASNSDQHRTTMILLCEDGSLRIYMANVEATNFWMSPYLQPQSPISVLKPTRKKKSAKAGRPSNSVLFPVDFFEHCQHTNDVEFGGNDVLEVYNVQQVKSRLNTTGQYIASTKNLGFTLEVTNTNSSTLIAGIRVLVGSQSVERAPSYVEVFGRTNPIQLNSRARWFDIPFTREESINADKKLFITFGCSVDPAFITMVDSIKVYVKTKELLGWPEEQEDFPEQIASSAAKMTNAISSAVGAPETEATAALPLPMTLSDRLLASALEVLDGVFSSLPESEESTRRTRALSLATLLLNLNCPDLVQLHTKSLVASLFPNKPAYHNHKDQAQLKHVMSCLTMPEGTDLDVEAFQRLLVTARSVSVSRPLNLVKFAQTQDANQTLEVTDLEEECIESKEPLKTPPTTYSLTEIEKASFTSRLVEAFWKLHASKPANPMLAPVCLPGLTNVEVTVCALVEVIHAFTMCDPECVQLATKHYMRLLLSKDLVVSFACRQALIRVLRPRQRRRRVYIPSPPHCTLQGSSESRFDENSSEKEDKPVTPSIPVFLPPASADVDQDQPEQESDVLYEVVDNNLLLEEGGAHANDLQAMNELWRMAESYPPMVEIPPDADDETMVELAIALSLQEQGNGQVSLPGGLPQQLANNLGINIGQAASGLGLQNLGHHPEVAQEDDEVEMEEASDLDRLDIAMAQGAGGISLQDLGLRSVPPQEDDLDIEERPLSDTTASAPASDDEIGSTAATDGSTLRTSPAEHGGGSGGGSESGGSAVDSISATSGRSSSYGFHAIEGLPAGQREEQAGFEASSAFYTSGTDAFEPDTGTTQSIGQGFADYGIPLENAFAMARRSPSPTYAYSYPEDGPYDQSTMPAVASNFLSGLHTSFDVYENLNAEASRDGRRSRSTSEEDGGSHGSKGTSRSLRALPEEDAHRPETSRGPLRTTGTRTSHASSTLVRPDGNGSPQLSGQMPTAAQAIPRKENGKAHKSDGIGGGSRSQREDEHDHDPQGTSSERHRAVTTGEKNSGARRKTSNPPSSPKKQSDKTDIATLKMPSHENNSPQTTSQYKVTRKKSGGSKMEFKTQTRGHSGLPDKRTIGDDKASLPGRPSENKSTQNGKETSSNEKSNTHDSRKTSEAAQNKGGYSPIPPTMQTSQPGPCGVTGIRSRTTGTVGASGSSKPLPQELKSSLTHRKMPTGETCQTYASGVASKSPETSRANPCAEKTEMPTAAQAIPQKENGKAHTSDGIGGRSSSQREDEHDHRHQETSSERHRAIATGEKHSGARKKTSNPPSFPKKQSDKTHTSSHENHSSHTTSQCKVTRKKNGSSKMESKTQTSGHSSLPDKRTMGAFKTSLPGRPSENNSTQNGKETSSNGKSNMHDTRKTSEVSRTCNANPNEQRSSVHVTPRTAQTNESIRSPVTGAPSRTSGTSEITGTSAVSGTSEAARNEGGHSPIPPTMQTRQPGPCGVTGIRSRTTGTVGTLPQESQRTTPTGETCQTHVSGVASRRPGASRANPCAETTSEMPRTRPGNQTNRIESFPFLSAAWRASNTLIIERPLVPSDDDSWHVGFLPNLGCTRASASNNIDSPLVSNANAGSGSIIFSRCVRSSSSAISRRSATPEKSEGSSLSQSVSETLSFGADSDSTPPEQTLGTGGRASRMPRAGRDSSKAKDSASTLPGPLRQENEEAQNGRFVEIVIVGREGASSEDETIRLNPAVMKSEERPQNKGRRRHCAGDSNPVERVTNREAVNLGDRPLESLCHVTQQVLSEEEGGDRGSRVVSESGRNENSSHLYRLIPVPRNLGNLVDPSELLRLASAPKETNRRKANSRSPRRERGSMRRDERENADIHFLRTLSESLQADAASARTDNLVEEALRRFSQPRSPASSRSPELQNSVSLRSGTRSRERQQPFWNLMELGIYPEERNQGHRESCPHNQPQPIQQEPDKDSDAESGNYSFNSSSDSDSEERLRRLRRVREVTALGRPTCPIAKTLSCRGGDGCVCVYLPCPRLHDLRRRFLEALLVYFPEVQKVGGVRAIPFMQVLLMLTSDLDSDEEKDRAVLDLFLTTILHELDLSGKDLEDIVKRSESYEVKLILLRLLSVLLSRSKSGSKHHCESAFVSNSTASALLSSGAIPYCLKVLQSVLPFWKNFTFAEDEKVNVPGQLLKPHPAHAPPDMSPFFLRQYVKNHASDIFEEYPQLLTEMVLRLPYQLKKIADEQKLTSGTFDTTWHDILSEYMLTQQSPFVKRQVRKLLLFLCGSKDKYRQLRDDHTIQSHLHQLQELCTKWGLEAGLDMPAHSIILPYDTLLTMIEHLKAVCDIAMSRPYNWQLFCQLKPDTLPYLIQASILLDEGVAPTLLQLLQYAICGVKSSGQGHGNSGSGSSSTSPVKQKGKKDRDKSSKAEEPEESRPFDESLCQELVKQLNTSLSASLLIKFVRTYLLDSNSSGNRWMAHALVLQIYRNSSNEEQQTLLDSLWGLWQDLPVFGRKAAQFVDLLGYFVLKTPGLAEKKVQEYLQKTVALLKRENQVLAHHPNATIYNMLQGLVDFDGYYLESDPCLVCNNPEVPFQTLKLSAVKVDSKFTTTTQIVKLVGSHTISKISLRISDLKRTKMVQTLNIYYNNRSVQAVVELKNRPGLWHKARKVKLTSGQTEVKVEFPIPIVACNLMIEYADFYDNLQATAETLQCPRCSASVPASPGVCGNCGENVYQCHKCRSINYDEKDPFLCISCGFCKYAKFDYTLMGKPCCAVDPIENEEDRKKAITSINNLLDKADRIYKQLQLHRPDLESLLIQVTEHGSERTPSGSSKEGGGTAGTVPVSSVNKAIQLLAQKYCGECKAAFDELSKLIQKVMACRRELVEYDQQQRAAVAAKGQAPPTPTNTGSKASPMEAVSDKAIQSKGKKESLRSGKCYGCASAAVEHCIMLLRALVTNATMRQMLCNEGMIRQLIDYNLRHGALSVRAEIRNLLCLLTRDNRKGTDEMNALIMARITAAVKGHQSNPDLGSSVRHEIMLLASSLLQDDSCWEQRTRCVMRLFLMGMQMRSPVIMESITLPCLRILQGLIKQDLISFINDNKESETQPDSTPAIFHMDIKKWLSGDPSYSYQNWKKRLPKPASTSGPDTTISVVDKKHFGTQQQRPQTPPKLVVDVREAYLTEKYATRWKRAMWKVPSVVMKLTQTTWLQQAIFSPSSRSARQTACSVVEVISQVFSRRKEVIDMLTGCLQEVGQSGECATEFLALYKSLIAQDRWKFYLAIKGVMLTLGRLITKEVEHLQYLEETTLNSDLAQGFALKALTELLALFVEQEQLKQHYKNRLVGCVLNCYLSLRKLVVQRTKLIDDTQEGLLQMLEELTSGTTSETKEFMAVCVQTVKNYPLDDYRSPIFIFERLCSIIYPEENDVNEFFLILEKDPQQEDFLQGRMLGNPYSSVEQGMGPLMRDIKNKICTDCELVALLEDDTGMELLVNKKIISLDLPVKDVYKKIWLPEHGEVEPMPVVYRMRGLLGDATEDMVNSLDSSTEENEDKEEVYKMAAVLSDCGGLQVMLERLASIKDLVLGKQLMVVLLKLFSYAVHVKANRQRLTNPDLGCVNIMLGALNLALWSEQEGVYSNKGQTITEQVLHIMEVVLLEASQQAPEVYTEFSKTCGDKEQLLVMLDRINSPIVRFNPGVLEGLMRLVPFLAFGEEDKMEALLSHFKPYLNFDTFDEEHSQDEEIHLNCFCSIASAIESNANGIRLKDLILRHGVVQTVISYILNHAPEIKTMLATDSEVWKGFLSKQSLSFALRMLTGLCTKHIPTQNVIAEKCIPILHKLEQVSSDQHLGTLAENLLDALKTNPEAAKKIEEVRQQTKGEKKRLAMAVRKKHLGALGMTTNERGQVTVKSSVLKQMEDLKEETGLTCCICREGYRYQPQKVLAVYTYSRRSNMDDYESKTRKTLGYCTVTHFNVIHVDCHTAAVRHARGREEWESAALQNANTRCNGLLPIWGPQVQESVFASCLARHNNYLQECTGIRDLNYSYNIHDLKLLFLRFAAERSFSDESGGGGPQSNLYFVPFVMHMILYAVNTTRAAGREEKNLTGFLDMPPSKWADNSGEVEGVLYFIILAMHLMTPERWKECRHKFLQRILVTAHVRAVCPLDSQQNMPALKDKSIQPYSAYKSLLVLFGMVCAMYDKIFVKVKVPEGGQWGKALFEYIRHNDKTMLEQCDSVLRMYQEELLPCESLSEFVDVVGMLEEVPDPDKSLTDALASIPERL